MDRARRVGRKRGAGALRIGTGAFIRGDRLGPHRLWPGPAGLLQPGARGGPYGDWGISVVCEESASSESGKLGLFPLDFSGFAGSSHHCRRGDDGGITWLDPDEVGDLTRLETRGLRYTGRRSTEVLLQDQDHSAADARRGAIASRY